MDEDLSFYEGTGTGPDVEKIKAALHKQSLKLSFTAKISAEEGLRKIIDVPGWWGVGFEGSAEKHGNHFTIKMGPEAWFN